MRARSSSLKTGNHLAEDVDGVGNGAAVDAAVQVVVGTGDLYLPVAQAAQAAGDAGYVGGNHAGVAHQDDIGFQHLFVLFAEAVKAGGTNLLFALKHKLHVAGQLAGLHHKLESLGLHETLPLVVVGAAGPDFAILHHGLKRLGVPQLKRGHRHHVVVAIYQHSGFGGVNGLLAIHYRIAG